jgi:hypothetical protein
MHKIPQAKLQVPVGRKVESASVKTSLASQHSKTLQMQATTTVVSSLPKPMAAIKGTTKQQQQLLDDKQQKIAAIDEQCDVILSEKVQNNNINNNNIDVKTQIVNPLASPLHHQLMSQCSSNNNNNNNTITMTDSLTSTNNQSNSNSSDSSVIYRASMVTATDIYQHANRKLENFNDPMLINGNKFGTPTKVNGIVQNTIFEDDKEITSAASAASAIVAMRSSALLRGFNNHMSPSRINRTQLNGYYDENGQGYCSDGDALRKSTIRYSDIENGYLSEGPHFLSILRNRPQMPSTIAEER